jgi:hydroxymethylglutaryl-CoA synthase
VDRLAFSPSPPLVSAIVAFEKGGRLQCELTDVGGQLEVGDEVVPTFRRGATVDGIHNYIWKCRPAAQSQATENSPTQNSPTQNSPTQNSPTKSKE